MRDRLSIACGRWRWLACAAAAAQMWLAPSVHICLARCADEDTSCCGGRTALVCRCCSSETPDECPACPASGECCIRLDRPAVAPAVARLLPPQPLPAIATTDEFLTRAGGAHGLGHLHPMESASPSRPLYLTARAFLI